MQFSDDFSLDLIHAVFVSASHQIILLLKDLVPLLQLKASVFPLFKQLLSSLSVGGFPATPVPDQPCNCQNTRTKCRSAFTLPS